MAAPAESIRFITDHKGIDRSSLAALYEAVGFGTAEDYDHPSLTVNRLFGPGVYGFFALADEKLIGMARVLSDDALCSWIAEVVIHPVWQRRGVGSALLERINERFAHTSLYADGLNGTERFLRKHRIVPQSRLVACGRAPIRNLMSEN